MGGKKPRRMPIFVTTLLEEYEKYLNKRVKIKTITRNTCLNDANRVLEALVFVMGEEDIRRAMIAYGYRGYYKNVIRDLKQIVQQRGGQLKS